MKPRLPSPPARIPQIALLLRRAVRDLAAMRGRWLAIGLIAAIGMAIFAGTYSAIDSLFATRDAYYREGAMAELEIRFVPEDTANVPSFDDIPGITRVETRLVMPGHVELRDGRRLSALLIGTAPEAMPRLDRLTLLNGQPLDGSRPDEVVIERGLAQHHGFGVGDRLDLRVGKDRFDLRVRGVARSPEFLIASADPNVFLPTKGSLAVIYAPLDLLAQRLGFRLVNSLLFAFEPGADARALEEALAQRAGRKLTVEEVVPRRSQFGALFLQVDLKAFAVFVPAIVAIFGLASVAITQFLLFQWIAGQRREVGLLMALGYGRLRLALAYLAPAAIVAGLAAAAGTLLAWFVLERFGSSYAQAIGLPPPHLRLGATWLAWGVVGVPAALGLASLWPQARLLSLTPQDAVRGERVRLRPALGRLLRPVAARLGGNLKLRYALRGALRGRATSVMTIVSIALALGVSLAYFMAMTSFEENLVQRFSRDRWDVSVGFLAPVWDDELDLFRPVPGLRAVDPFLRGAVRLVRAERRKSVPVIGVDPQTSLRRIDVLAGRGLVAGDRDVLLLERQTATEWSLQVGDTVELEAHGARHSAKLVGTFSGILPGEVYAPRETVQRWLDLGEQSSGAFLQVDNPSPELVARLFALERVGRVTLKAKVIEELLTLTHEILAILYLAAAFSIVVAVLFVTAVTSFLVLDRQGEYNTLRLLGLADRDVVGLILVEVFCLGALGAALSVPLGYALATFLTARMSDAWFVVAPVARLGDVATVVLPALLALPLAAWPAIRRVRSSSLTQTLRERMFG